MDKRFENVEMPEFLRKALDEFLEAKKDPTKERMIDLYKDELEGAVKDCAVWGSISQEVADEIMQTYL